MLDTLPFFIPAPKDETLFAVARGLAVQITARTEISRRSLTADMTAAFGASDATGTWSMRDAYDALEVAEVIAQLDPATPLADARAPGGEMLKRMTQIAATLPTQTYRSEGQVALQQFSTPMPLAYLAARAAQITANDIVLEPSAGTGLLAAHAVRTGARLLLNEIDPLRAGLLSRLFPSIPVSQQDGASIAGHVAVRPTVVVMNPPYSKSAGIGDDAYAGARHLRSALVALAEGGRLVAVMPSWFSPDASGAAGYAAVAKLVSPLIDILCKGSVYAKHGTGIDIRLVVYDKGRDAPTVRHEVGSLHDLLTLLFSLPARLVTAAVTPKLAVPVSVPARPSLNPMTGGLMRRSSAPKPLAPRPPMLDLAGSDTREISYTARSEAIALSTRRSSARGTRSGLTAQYKSRRRGVSSVPLAASISVAPSAAPCQSPDDAGTLSPSMPGCPETGLAAGDALVAGARAYRCPILLLQTDRPALRRRPLSPLLPRRRSMLPWTEIRPCGTTSRYARRPLACRGARSPGPRRCLVPAGSGGERPGDGASRVRELSGSGARVA